MKRSFERAAGSGVIVLIIAVVLSGCPSPQEGTEPVLPGGGGIEEASSLFVDSETGEVVFSTNDSEYCGEYGYTLWTEGDTVYSPFSHLNVTLSKLEGNSDGGYGVVFCGDGTSMLLVLININREYLIGELDGNVFTAISEWIETEDLYGGYNQGNVVDITYDEDEEEFSLSFNGGDAVRFRDDEEPYHTEGRNGYIVVISSREDFPDVPVSVTFKEN